MAKKRNRAISLSLDWDNMVKEGESEKGAMAHLAGNIAYDKDTVEFCTGSSYTGKWNALGMAVYGTYLYPHGCEYEGGFEDGMFHGEGVLVYPMGQKLEGYWEKGKMMDYKFTNVDGLDYTEPWLYCTMPDRRYNVTIREGLQPAGREFLTNQQPDRPIEQDCYDTGDGFYNPITRSIIMARDPEEYENLEDHDSIVVVKSTDDDFWVQAVTMVNEARHDWITRHCRKAWDEPAGYRPDLYEDWITGRRKELEELDKKYASSRNSLESNGNGDVKNSLNDVNGQLEIKESVDYAGTGRKLAPSTSNM
ncbi:MORN repeat-containing protein 5 [Tribolium castaneum]|uniref:MORN repeat-containing protein 5 n=1 Tax=Tribolium castaneum TaxID=7070 RepID=UPI0030FE850C